MASYEEQYKKYSAAGQGQAINDLYDAQKSSQLTQLESAYRQSKAEAEAARDKLPGQYQQQANDLSAQYERNRRSFNQQAAASGLNTGTASQAALAQNSAYQQSMGKLRTAQRGHKLLKDKRDELMKQFLDTVREVRSLRAEVEEELMTVHKSFTVASALMSSEALEQALLYPKQSVELTQTSQNIMSVNVPVYNFQTKTRSDSDIYPYGFAATSGELDTAVDALGKVFQKMLKLAEIEKSAQLMAEEIEKPRRRVNALEYVMIPNTQEAIRYITMKLDENDRATTTRLMKVKDMILKESLEEKRSETAKAIETFGAEEKPV